MTGKKVTREFDNCYFLLKNPGNLIRKRSTTFLKVCPAQQKIKMGLNGSMPRSSCCLTLIFTRAASFTKEKRSIRFPAALLEFYNSSTITALENQFSSITDFSRTIKCSKLALRVTRVWKTSGQ